MPSSMAGHGLLARRPESAYRRPFDTEAFAAEPSPIADVDAGALLSPCAIADPLVVGAARIDTATHREQLREALYGDVDPATADAAYPDYPDYPTTVVTLDASHSPFLSMPHRLADIVTRLG